MASEKMIEVRIDMEEGEPLGATPNDKLVITKIQQGTIAEGKLRTPEFPHYSIAKAALDQYTRNTAIDLIQHGIRVNSISPGLVATGFGSAMGMPEEVSKKFYSTMATMKECVPAGFMGQPQDIAEAIAFLADRKSSSYIIGHQLVVDGGSSLVMGLHCQDFSKLLQ